MVLIALALLVPLLMLSAALLTILFIVAVIGGGIFWWKTRALRQQMRAMREFPSPVMSAQGEGGVVIEGEVIRVPTER